MARDGNLSAIAVRRNFGRGGWRLCAQTAHTTQYVDDPPAFPFPWLLSHVCRVIGHVKAAIQFFGFHCSKNALMLS